MKQLLSFLFLVALLTGCATLRNDQTYRPDEPLSVTAKVAAQIESDKLNQSVGGTLRMQRDHQVQLSLSKFGIEGARIVFTPDSVIVLDRINKRYFKDTYAVLNRFLSETQPLTFQKVQTFFWNDERRSNETADFNVMGFVPVELFIQRSNTTNVRGYRVAQNTVFAVHAFEKDFKLNLRLKNVRINYDWSAQLRIPSGYTPMKPENLLKIFR